MVKLTCPLLAHPCIERRCSWWSSEHSVCVSVGIFNQMAAAKEQAAEAAPTKAKRIKKAQGSPT